MSAVYATRATTICVDCMLNSFVRRAHHLCERGLRIQYRSQLAPLGAAVYMQEPLLPIVAVVFLGGGG